MGTRTGAGMGRDGDGDGSGDGNESSRGDGNGNGNDDRIGEGRREAKKRKKLHTSCRRHVGNGENLDGKREKRRNERVGPVAANPDNLESSNEEGKAAQGTQGSRKNCASRESVSLLSRLIRGFCSKYHWSRLGRISASGI